MGPARVCRARDKDHTQALPSKTMPSFSFLCAVHPKRLRLVEMSAVSERDGG